MRPKARSYLLRAAVVVAAFATLPAVPSRAGTLPVPDSTFITTLHADADTVRKSAHLDALYERTAYSQMASRVTASLVAGTTIPRPGDDAPMSYLTGTSMPAYYQSSVDGAIDAVVDAAHAVLVYPLHTDAGWSVRGVVQSNGTIRWAVVLIVGWPDPATSSNSGCAVNGYCWSTRGLNPHLPWTRNTLTWYLSSSGLPVGAESLVKTAISRLNSVSGYGVDLAYGGRTTDTGPTAAHRFVIYWGSGCSSSTALACTLNGTQGTYHLIYQSRTIVNRARYLANSNGGWWIGTLMHEMSHASGLGHFDGGYLGTYQLMRWANGPNSVQVGDANGLRKVAPGGRVSASVRAVQTSVGSYDLVVTASNAGLGGLRSIVTQCTDTLGAWKTVATVTGRWDTRPASRTVGNVFSLVSGTKSCRAVVKSKTNTVTTSSISV
jgi:hypothetical protein